MIGRPPAGVSVMLLITAVGMASAAGDVPVASGAARLPEAATVYVANLRSGTVTRDQG